MLQIQFLDMERSEAVEGRVWKWADRLGRCSDDIQKCQVWIQSARGHHRKGFLYAVRVRVTVPGEEIAVDLQPSEEDAHLAVRKAFQAVRRKLQDYERRRGGRVKAHPRETADASRRRVVAPRFERA